MDVLIYPNFILPNYRDIHIFSIMCKHKVIVINIACVSQNISYRLYSTYILPYNMLHLL
jgi:hypothetical protein